MDSDVLKMVFETCALEKDDWDHEAHVHMGWIYLREVPLAKATARLRDGIFRYPEDSDPFCRYHETLTRFWMTQIGRALEGAPEGESFPEFLERNPHLQDKRLVLQYYSQPVLMSEEARESWVEPNRAPLETPPRSDG